MKNLFLLIAIASITFDMNVNAQLKVLSNGKVGVGTLNPYEAFQIGDRWTFYSGGSKYIGYNMYYSSGVNKRIAADAASCIGFNSGTGDINFAFAGNGSAGSLTNEKIMLNLAGTPCNYGIRLDNLGYNNNEASFHPTVGNYCDLGTNNYYWYRTYSNFVFTNLVSILSDKTIKSNITTISNPIETIIKLRGVQFDFTESAFNYTTGSKKEILLKKGKDNLGFIAQEVGEILPQLVDYDTTADRYYLNYIGIIPVLVEAVKQQQTMIEIQNTKIETLEKRLEKIEINNKDKNFKSGDVSDEKISSNGSVIPLLFQNSPNPFNQSTKIGYYLPESVKNATIYIYNLEGMQIKSMDLIQKGTGFVTIDRNELKAGIYYYSLIADEKEIDTKKMILTK